MRNFCMLLFLLAIGGASVAQTTSDSRIDRQRESSRSAVAVADFSGDDPATGKFLADTLLTDLSQSRQMRMVERSEIKKAMDELKLQDTLVFEPQQARELGRLIRADELIVGSYLIRDGQVMVNARLLDLATGRVVSGGASNVTGDSHALFTVVHRLAHLLHRRVTGQDFVIDGEGSQPADPSGRAYARTNGSEAPSYHVGQQSDTRPAPAPAPRASDSSTANNYHVRESGDVVAPPVVVPVPEPVYVPYYYPYSYPYYDPYYLYPYPYSSLSFSFVFGRGIHRGGFSRFGVGAHVGFPRFGVGVGFGGHAFRGRR